MALLPVILPEEKVVRGQDFQPTYEVRDANGVLVDLTLAGIEVRYRTLQGATLIQKLKSTGSSAMDVTTTGRTTPKFSQGETAGWVAGFVAVELIIEVNSVRTYYAQGVLRVEDPTTGVPA